MLSGASSSFWSFRNHLVWDHLAHKFYVILVTFVGSVEPSLACSFGLPFLACGAIFLGCIKPPLLISIESTLDPNKPPWMIQQSLEELFCLIKYAIT